MESLVECNQRQTASVVWWAQFMTANLEILGSILGATKFSA
jgi:hypothetical protein